MTLPSEALYTDLRDLSLAVRIAWHQAQAQPKRAEEILAQLTADVRRLSSVTAMHLRSAEAQVAARNNAVEKAADAAERRIRAALGKIAAGSIGDDFNPQGYFVYCLWGSDRERPLYVGLSRNVLNRLGTHLVNPQRRHLVTRVTLIRCKTESAMVATEGRLIREYQPPWNVTGILDRDVA